MTCSCISQVIFVGPKKLRAVIPAFLPARGWSLHTKGYLIYTSKSPRHGIRRGARAHRLAIAYLLGRELMPDEIIHHMDFDKLNCAFDNLLKCPAAFNPAQRFQCPITGTLLTREEWGRRYGWMRSEPPKEDMPDWVTEDTAMAQSAS